MNVDTKTKIALGVAIGSYTAVMLITGFALGYVRGDRKGLNDGISVGKIDALTKMAESHYGVKIDNEK